MAKIEGVGERIKFYREQRGMTQSQLSAWSGVSRSVLNNLETGRRDQVYLTTAAKIAGALGISIDLLCRQTYEEAEAKRVRAAAKAGL